MSSRLEPDPVGRRDFLGLAGLGAALIALFGSVAGMARLPKPTLMPEPGSRFRIGAMDEIPVGGARVIPERNVRVVRSPRGVAVMSLVCTHLGCIVAEGSEGFNCPCHGSRFGRDGGVLGGPAPRGLRWLEVSRAADGTLLADADREVPAETWFAVEERA